jgi:hypothetical protein
MVVERGLAQLIRHSAFPETTPASPTVNDRISDVRLRRTVPPGARIGQRRSGLG